jgi:hypothetical protein
MHACNTMGSFAILGWYRVGFPFLKRGGRAVDREGKQRQNERGRKSGPHMSLSLGSPSQQRCARRAFWIIVYTGDKERIHSKQASSYNSQVFLSFPSPFNQRMTDEFITQLASETVTTALFRRPQIPRVLKGLHAEFFTVMYS